MNLCIKYARSVTAEDWDHIWRNCDYATYFHSREWAEIWQIYTHSAMKPDGKILKFSDGKAVLLPFSSQRILRGLAKQYISSPAGTFGGWLSLDELSESHRRLLYKYIIVHYKNLMWRLNPYDYLVNSLNIDNSEDDTTQVLNLENGVDVLYKKWTKGHASAARAARAAGVQIQTATTLTEYKAYYEVYEDSLKRWGESASSKYDWRLFQNIFNRSSPDITLWLSLYDDRVIAGALCFYAKRHVVYWHGAALSAYFNLRPVNLLMYEIIKNSCERDYRWFDFNPSGGHEGVKAFKRSFGAEELKCPIVNKNVKLVKLVQTGIFHVKSRILSKR